MDTRIEQPKKKQAIQPTLTLSPGLSGATVIETNEVAESFMGAFYPWYRILQLNRGSCVQIMDEKNEKLKLPGKWAVIKIIGTGKLVSRLQDRAARNWANTSDKPITFEPIEESYWGWGCLMAAMVGACGYLFLPMALKAWGAVVSGPMSMYQILAWVALFFLAITLLLPVVLVWNLRPRKRSFAEIDLVPSGIIGTTSAGEVVTLVFTDLKETKLKKGDLMRCRMKTRDGLVYWMVLRRPISRYGVRALYPSNETQKQSNAIVIRAMYRQGVRFMIIGVVLAILGNTLTNYLVSIGAILPADVKLIRRGLIGFPLLFAGMLGLQLCWVAWKFSPKGKRAIKAIKSSIARFSKPKEQTKDAAP